MSFQTPPGAAEADGRPRGEQLGANRGSQRSRENNGELKTGSWVEVFEKMMNCGEALY